MKLCDDAEDITNKLHGPCALLLTHAQREKRIFAECTGVVPAKYPPKIKSELFSLLESSERVKSCVPFFVRVLGFYSSRVGPFFLGVEVFSL